MSDGAVWHVVGEAWLLLHTEYATLRTGVHSGCLGLLVVRRAAGEGAGVGVVLHRGSSQLKAGKVSEPAVLAFALHGNQCFLEEI